MADRSLGTLTLNVVAEVGGFEAGMNRAERAQEKVTRQMERDQKTAERANKSFLDGLQAQADAVGKTRTQLLELQAAQRGLTQQAAPYIAKLKEQEAALQKGGVTAAQTAAALRGVPAQFTDIFVSLQGGQAPLTVFLQQGGQLKDMFGGIGPAARALGGYILNLVNPFTVSAAAIAGFVALAVSADRRIRDLSDTAIRFNVTGRAIDTAGVDALIARLNELPGITRSSATEIVNSFAGVRQIGPGILEPLALIVADFAKATGLDAPKAAEKLAEAFKDPVAGAKSLDEQLNILSADQLLNIQRMVEQNNVAGAQAILLEALTGKVQGLANQGMTPLSRSADNLSNNWDRLKRVLADPSGFSEANIFLSEIVNKMALIVEYGARARINKNNLADQDALLGIPTRPATPVGSRSVSGRIGYMEGGSGRGVINPPFVVPEDNVKALLATTAQFKSQASEARKVREQIDSITGALQKMRAEGKQDSASYKELSDRLVGAQEKLESLNKKGGGGRASPVYRDDAATKFLATLKEQEATLNAQLQGVDKLTNSQKELVKFEQQLADLKEKKTLTAEQKSLVAAQDSILAQLRKNVAIESEVKARDDAVKKAEELARKDQAFAERARQRDEALKSSLETRAQGYEQTLGAFGQSDRARQQVEQQKTILREFQRYQLDLVKNTPEHLLGSDKFVEEMLKIKSAQDQALQDFAQFYEDLRRLEGDWQNGANRALATYIDDVANVSSQIEQLVSGAFKGMEDALVNFVTTGKLSFTDLANSIVADITRIIVRQQITGPLAQLIQGGLKDGSGAGGLLGSLFGGLFGSSASKGGEGAAAASTAALAASSTTAAASISALATAAAAAATSLGGQSAASAGGGFFGWLGSLFGGGRANGGPVSKGSFYQVNERENELLVQGGKTYLMAGANGTVKNMPAGSGSTVNVYQSFPPGTNMKTVEQAASQAGMAAQRALARGTA